MAEAEQPTVAVQETTKRERTPAQLKALQHARAKAAEVRAKTQSSDVVRLIFTHPLTPPWDRHIQPEKISIRTIPSRTIHKVILIAPHATGDVIPLTLAVKATYAPPVTYTNMRAPRMPLVSAKIRKINFH